MRSSRNRPSLTINTPTFAPPLQNNPYQTPQASVSNFTLPETPVLGQPRPVRTNLAFSIASEEDLEDKLCSPLTVDYDQYLDEPGIVFSKAFDTLLVNTYQAHVGNPQATPFSSRYPPLGVVLKAAKDSIKAAFRKQVPIEAAVPNSKWQSALKSARAHLLTEARARLLVLCHTPDVRSSLVLLLTALNTSAMHDAFTGLSLLPPNALPMVLPVGHTFLPINVLFGNVAAPELGVAGASNTALIHEALNSYIIGSQNRPQKNPPLTPITPIAPYSRGVGSPLAEGFGNLSLPFRENFRLRRKNANTKGEGLLLPGFSLR